MLSQIMELSKEERHDRWQEIDGRLAYRATFLLFGVLLFFSSV
jgi:hypothetical protein